MKTSERRHLKDNDLALFLSTAQQWWATNQQTLLAAIGAIVIVGGGVGAYRFYTGSVDAKARGLLAVAMVVEESRVQPPGPPAGTTNDPADTPGQAPGTYPTEQLKHEAALPKFMAAADAYPTTEPGLMARYYAASTLVAMGRFDDAIKQYDQVIAGGGTGVLARMSKMGKAQAQLGARQFDPAIATFKEMSEQKDAGAIPADAVLMELGRAYRLAGKTEDAKKTFTQVVEQHADSPFAADAKAELENLKG